MNFADIVLFGLCLWSLWKTWTLGKRSMSKAREKGSIYSVFLAVLFGSAWGYLLLDALSSGSQLMINLMASFVATNLVASVYFKSLKHFNVSGKVNGLAKAEQKWTWQNMYQFMREAVYGQDRALKTISQLLSIRLGKKRYDKPIAIFLAVGPTGVGKTETAKRLAQMMKQYDPRYSLLPLDMSGFYSDITASFMVGSPPGYIGSEEGGKLTRPLIENPYRVILFDEIEKAYPTVMDVFLQIFDEGRLIEMSSGEFSYFDKSVIFMTSNLAAQDIGEVMSDDSLDDVQKEMKVKDLLVKGTEIGSLKPELLGRIDEILIYNALSDDDYVEVITRAIKKWDKNIPASSVREKAHAIFQKYQKLRKYGVREILRKAEKEVVFGEIDEGTQQ